MATEYINKIVNILDSEEEVSSRANSLRPRSEMTPEEKQEFGEFLFSLPPVDAYNAEVKQWLEERGFDPAH